MERIFGAKHGRNSMEGKQRGIFVRQEVDEKKPIEKKTTAKIFFSLGKAGN